MAKRVISKSSFDFLKSELEHHKNQNSLTEEQLESILGSYQTVNRFSFVKVLLVIGAILIGLGILSFVASNWQYMSNLFRFSLIIGLFLAVNFASLKISNAYIRISQSLLYLSVFIFGAGIFLVGQMFHLGGHFTGAFLLWGAGILPMAILFKDKLIFTFAHLLLLIYLVGYTNLPDMPYYILILIPLLYYLNKSLDYSKLGTFSSNLLLLTAIAVFGDKLGIDMLYVVIFLFVIGLVMFFAPIKFNEEIFRLQGNLVIGITGLILTFKYIWREPFSKGGVYFEDAFFTLPDTLSVVFAILYLIFLFFLVRKKSLISLVFICITIFRFYVDTLIDFMPKSLFFIIGGLLLLGFGYYFERMRKEQGGIYHE